MSSSVLKLGDLALFTGHTWHVRHQPTQHRFTYRYDYLGFWAASIPKLKLSWWLSSAHKALIEIRRGDYLRRLTEEGEPLQTTGLQATDPQMTDSLEDSVLKRLSKILDSDVSGRVLALIKPRGLFAYFSPVNFYLVFNPDDQCTHLLAEVTNTPWGEQHCYGLDLSAPLKSEKDFTVSPFNPLKQRYDWLVEANLDSVRIVIKVSDERGQIMDAGVKLDRKELKHSRWFALTHAATNLRTLALIYWHALILYAVKRTPFLGKKG
jgi:DUF1365 family protein